MRNNKPIKILLAGSYHTANLGDLALLETYLYKLKKEIPHTQITVASLDPKSIREQHKEQIKKSYKITNIFKNFFEIIRNDVLILGGGGLLFDYSFFDTLSMIKKSQLLYWTSISILAKLLGKRVIWSGLGVGPITTKFAKSLLKLSASKIDSITVRDTQSFDLLNSICKTQLPNLKKTADIVWIWREDPLYKPSASQSKKIILTPRSVDEEIDKLIIEKYSEIATSKELLDYTFKIISTNVKRDNKICQDLFSIMQNKVEVEYSEQDQNPTVKYIVEEISKSALVISMRMHALIWGALAGIPGIGIDYKTPKIHSLDKMLIGIKSFDLEAKIQDITSWAETFLQDTKVYREELLAQTIELSEKAKENIEEINHTIKTSVDRKHNFIKTILQIAISILLFYFLSKRINIISSFSLIKSADLSLVIAALMLRIIAIYPSSSIWRRSLYYLSGKEGRFTLEQRKIAFLTYFQSYFFDNLGLGSLAGDAYRALQLAEKEGIIKSAGSVFVEKLSGVVFLIWVAVSLYIQRFLLENNNIVITILAVGLGFLVTPAMLSLGFWILNWIKRKSKNVKLLNKISIIKNIFELNIKPDYNTAFDINLRVAAFYFVSAFALMLTARSIGVLINFPDAVFVFTTLLFISTLPISFQGIGVRDVTLAALLSFIGQGADSAVAIATLLLIQKLTISLIGGIIYLLPFKKSYQEK